MLTGATAVAKPIKVPLATLPCHIHVSQVSVPAVPFTVQLPSIEDDTASDGVSNTTWVLGCSFGFLD